MDNCYYLICFKPIKHYMNAICLPLKLFHHTPTTPAATTIKFGSNISF